ncbi:MAG: UdgX family uracil-DNA binding protein [Actinobacteria bacterium]|nr:UdgX family uracil-DNA binding protein [Actinomycetota bacterium]
MQQSFAGDRPLAEIAAEAAKCTDCDLYRNATQTVFGEGPEDAEVVLMGEQPGDKEDKSGHPFVGPAGKLLDRALEEAGIDRSRVYITNAVKHFKWRPAGKVRLHQKPNREEVNACRQWWELELAAISPKVLVCLGATAAQAVFGPSFRVTKERGRFQMLPAGVDAVATVHPSSILRAEERREAEFADFVDDLRAVAARLG